MSPTFAHLLYRERLKELRELIREMHSAEKHHQGLEYARDRVADKAKEARQARIEWKQAEHAYATTLFQRMTDAAELAHVRAIAECAA